MNKKDEAQGMSRRSFLKNAAIVAVIPTGVTSLQASAANPSFIRVRRNAASNGWKYYRVKTVANDFPKTADEKDFVPSIYGGNLAIVREGTGRFRTEKIDGRWWFIDPNGHPFLSAGVNAVSPTSGAKIAAKAKEVGYETWSATAVKSLREMGFNTAGYWSKSYPKRGQNCHSGIPYVFYDFGVPEDRKPSKASWPQGLMQIFSSKVGGDGEHHPIFHEGFEKFCEERCSKVIMSKKNDPWLLGYFTDNELKFKPLATLLASSELDPVYGPATREAKRWLVEFGGSPSSQETVSAWTAHAFEWYYKITTQAIRKYDPEHLQLGSRVYSAERNYRAVFEVAGRYLDVVSINPYGIIGLPVADLVQWSNWTGDKPLIVGEFYARGLDAKAQSQRGAGFTVATQSDRGLYYQNYVIQLIASKVCIGWHWHRFVDHESENGDAQLSINKGLMNEQLEMYKDMTSMMKDLNVQSHRIASRI